MWQSIPLLDRKDTLLAIGLNADYLLLYAIVLEKEEIFFQTLNFQMWLSFCEFMLICVTRGCLLII